MKISSILREIFSRSPDSNISAKRVFGSITLMVSLGCTVYLTVTEGGTRVVENLIQTAFIIAASLLGIASVTGIWKHPDNEHKKEK